MIRLNRIVERRKALILALQSKIPSAYQRVKYIESSGTQYINTGVSPNDVQFGIEVKFSMDTSAVNEAQAICGSANTGGNYKWNSIGYSVANGDFYVQYSKNSTTNTFRLSPTDNNFEISYSISGTSITAVMNTSAFADTCDSYSNNSNNIYLFARNDNGNATLKACVKIHKVKMTSNNLLVREFIPCYRKSDNVIGLYDIVNGVFYTNSGTGKFGYEKLDGTYIASTNV